MHTHDGILMYKENMWNENLIQGTHQVHGPQFFTHVPNISPFTLLNQQKCQWGKIHSLLLLSFLSETELSALLSFCNFSLLHKLGRRITFGVSGVISFLLCCIIMWRFSLLLWVYSLPQRVHLYGFSPVCVSICLFRTPLRAKFFPHSLQLNGFSPVCPLKWTLKSLFCKKLFPQ